MVLTARSFIIRPKNAKIRKEFDVKDGCKVFITVASVQKRKGQVSVFEKCFQCWTSISSIGLSVKDLMRRQSYSM